MILLSMQLFCSDRIVPRKAVVLRERCHKTKLCNLRKCEMSVNENLSRNIVEITSKMLQEQQFQALCMMPA